MQNLRIVAAALCVLGLARTAAASDAWPSGPTRIIVPFAAGSTPDGLGRLLADRLQARSGKTFVVENRAGASGNTGTDAVAKAAPDGTTIGLSIVGPLVLNRLLFGSMPYHTLRDLAAITVVARQPSILVVSTGWGVHDLNDLVTKLKVDGGRLNYGSIGYGSLSHLAMASIAARVGAEPQHIAYAGSPAVVTALVRGDVQMAVLPAGSVVPQARAGLVRMLAATGSQRSPMVEDVPTLGEGGIDGVDASAWVGLIAPAGLPPAWQQSIREAIVSLLRDPGMAAKLETLFLEPVGSTSTEFEALMAQEFARWKPIIDAKKIRIE